jgi:phage tail tape-measure protein
VHHLAWLRDRLNEAYQSGLQQIAEATGGLASFSRAPGDIAGDVSQILRKMASHWAVDLELSAGTRRTYSVQLAVEGREIQYRTKYTLAPHAKGSPS